MRILCISCGGPKPVLYSNVSYMGLPVYQCKYCGLLTTGNSDEEVRQEATRLYMKEYWDDREAVKIIESNYTDQNLEYKRQQLQSQISYCQDFLVSGKSVLEIGSGPGQTLFWLEKMGFEVTGIEPDKRNVELINKKLSRGHCISGLVEDLTIRGRYDVIWISHVFEHLIRPDLLLERLHSNLDDNGIIFIEVPNCENPSILQSSIHDNPSSFHFSLKSLMLLASKTSFNVVRHNYMRESKAMERIVNRNLKRIHVSAVRLYPYFPFMSTRNPCDGHAIRIVLAKH